MNMVGRAERMKANRAFNESLRKMQKKKRKRNRKIYCQPQGEDAASHLGSHFTRSDYYHPLSSPDFNENFCLQCQAIV